MLRIEESETRVQTWVYHTTLKNEQVMKRYEEGSVGQEGDGKSK